MPPTPIKFDFGLLDVPGQKILEKFDAEGRKYLLGVGGVRGGKSWYGVRWVLKHAFARGGKIWIIIPEYGVGSELVRLMNQILYQHWEIVSNHHEHPFPKWDLKIQGTYGPVEIEIHSAYDPDSLIAATLSAAWIDEGARISPTAFRNIEERVLSTEGPILVTTTPRGKNWVFEELSKPFSEGNTRYGAAVLKTADNPHLPQEEIRQLRERWGMDSAYARQELEAEFVTFEGLVYAGFDLDRHVAGKAPEKFRGVWAGLDWGFAPSPAAFVVLGEDFAGIWWALHEIYAYRMAMPELAKLIEAAVRQFTIQTIWADPSQLAAVQLMQQAGIPVVPARRLLEINVGVQKIARLLERDRFKILSHCKNTIKELGLYHYPDGGKRDKPVDRDNHALDAIRYCIWMREPEERMPDEQVTVEKVLAFRDPGEPKTGATDWKQSGY